MAVIDYSKSISNKNNYKKTIPTIEHVLPLTNGVVVVKGSNFDNYMRVDSPELTDKTTVSMNINIVSDKELFFVPKDGIMTFFLVKDLEVCKDKNGNYLYRIENE